MWPQEEGYQKQRGRNPPHTPPTFCTQAGSIRPEPSHNRTERANCLLFLCAVALSAGEPWTRPLSNMNLTTQIHSAHCEFAIHAFHTVNGGSKKRFFFFSYSWKMRRPTVTHHTATFHFLIFHSPPPARAEEFPLVARRDIILGK